MIRFASRLLAFVGFLVAADTVAAQTGTLSGRVTRAAGTPVSGASVSVIRGLDQVATGQTGADGTYRIANIAAGVYSVVARSIGMTYERTDRVVVGAGGEAVANFTLTDVLSATVVTASGAGGVAEDQHKTSASISVVTAQQIETRPAATVTDHLKTQPGLAISNGGIVQANIVSRGFNNAFSTSMLMLQDFRFAGVPSLRVNVPFLFTGTGDDIQQIEVLQGPASALYGPNSSAGVLHVITKSPFDSRGTSITVDGGQRAFRRFAGRHAGVAGSMLAYKLSGEYMEAFDWQYYDLNETELGTGATQAQRDAYRVWSPTDPRVPASRQGVGKYRTFDLGRYAGEARVDFRPSENTEAVTTFGYSKILDAIEVTTTFGAAHAKNWSYSSFQQRFRHKDFFAQVFLNGSNSGNDDPLDDNGSYYLRSGIPVVDQSTVMVGQVRQGYSFAGTRFTAGIDYIRTEPKTKGTIMGRNEADDLILETGAYLQFARPLSEKLSFTGAARGDRNDRLEGTQFSPRAAFLYAFNDNQNLRFTFNRAFNSPASFSFFLDQWSGSRAALGPGIGQGGPTPLTDVQIFGNPSKMGWNYDRSCATAVTASGLCMRTNFAVGGQGLPVPASGSVLLPGMMRAPIGPGGIPLATAFGFGLQAQIPTMTNAQRDAIIAGLNGLAPSDAQVPPVLRNLGATGSPVVPFSSVNNFSALDAGFSNTWEIGYKARFRNNLRVAVDFWYQIRPAEPTTQVINLDDAVFLNPTNLGGYLGASMGATLAANGVPALNIPAIITAWTTQLAGIPGGLLNFDNPNYDRNYLVFTYQNAIGHIDVRGLDLAVDYLMSDSWTVAATYSNLSRNVFPGAPGSSAALPLTANSPKHRASLTFSYANVGRGISGEIRGRYADAMPVNSGVYNSFRSPSTALPYDAVPVNAFLDVGASYRLPIAQNVRWSLNVQNVFNTPAASFIGVPRIGRFATSRLQYSF